MDIGTASQRNTITPITSDDLSVRNRMAEDGIVAERCNDERTVVVVKMLKGRYVKMIIVVMRKKYDVDLWQVRELDPWLRHAARPDKCDRAGAVGPQRIG